MVQIAREFVRPGGFIFRRSWKRLITGVDVIVIGVGWNGFFFLPGKGMGVGGWGAVFQFSSSLFLSLPQS